jgi:predicted anti-sigma-YlaC factor YlaD
MNCETCRALLAAELYGDNTAEESLALKAHLDACSGCRELQAGWQKAAAQVPPLRVPEDESFWIRQRTAIMQQLPRQSSNAWNWHRLVVPVAALSIMVSAWGWRAERQRMDLRIAQNMDVLQDMDMLQQLDSVEKLDEVIGPK